MHEQEFSFLFISIIWFQSSSLLFSNIHCVCLPSKKQDKFPHPTVFSPPWFFKGTDPSLLFNFPAWILSTRWTLVLTPASSPNKLGMGLLPFYRQSWFHYLVHCTWELKFVWWMFFHEEIYLNHALLYEVFYINLLSLQRWFRKQASQKETQHYTSTDLINWKNNSSWNFSSRVLFFFNLAFTGVPLLKINFFNRTLNESTFSVVMLLACLFCLLKIERNKDENEAKTCLFHTLSIFLLHQGYKEWQIISLQRTMFLGTAPHSQNSCSS